MRHAMSFDTSSGTRGRRAQKGGPVTRWLSRRMIAWHRRKHGKFMGMDVLTLTTMGAKSGQPRQTAVSWFPDGDDAWLIVASAGGAVSHPAWFHNIAAHPDRIRIEFPDRAVDVVAEQLEGKRRDEVWDRITTEQPRYAGYQKQTDRVIPVVRLTRKEGVAE